MDFYFVYFIDNTETNELPFFSNQVIYMLGIFQTVKPNPNKII